MVIANELIILVSIILTDQQTTYLGREKAIFIITGLGLFIFGWTRLLLFNLSLSRRVRQIVTVAFIGAMLFYVFAVIITILITFNLVATHTFVGLGYSTAVGIYGTFLLMDLLAVIILANQKRKQSRYQAWIGLLLLLALLLNILFIVFNAIPLIIVNRVDPAIHVIFNYIIEPAVYFIGVTFSMLLLYWVLFNPKWLQNRSIEVGS